ncbi:hypothetical protein PFISCL1PPCAC_6934, partial [Pristionchus fissidentatus]
YEKASPQTLWVLFFVEIGNIIPAAMNSALWMLGYIDVAVNAGFLFLLNNFSIFVYFFTYKRNVRALTKMSSGDISFNSYSVAKTFQLRENVTVMKYFVSVFLPAASVSFPCFLYFAFHLFGPDELILPRTIGYALFDLHLIAFRVVYLYREITQNEVILGEFRKIRVVSAIIHYSPFSR